MAVKSLKRSTLESTYASDNSLNAGYSFQDFHHLETVSLGGSASSISFINLDKYAGEYKHLQIRAAARQTNADNWSVFDMRFNGDSGSNYAYHQLYGNGSSVTSNNPGTSATYIRDGFFFPGTGTANAFGAVVIDLLDAFAAKNKTARLFGGRMPSNDTLINLQSGLWMSTASINRIDFNAVTSSWSSGSRFSLYGIK